MCHDTYASTHTGIVAAKIKLILYFQNTCKDSLSMDLASVNLPYCGCWTHRCPQPPGPPRCDQNFIPAVSRKFSEPWRSPVSLCIASPGFRMPPTAFLTWLLVSAKTGCHTEMALGTILSLEGVVCSGAWPLQGSEGLKTWLEQDWGCFQSPGWLKSADLIVHYFLYPRRGPGADPQGYNNIYLYITEKNVLNLISSSHCYHQCIVYSSCNTSFCSALYVHFWPRDQMRGKKNVFPPIQDEGKAPLCKNLQFFPCCPHEFMMKEVNNCWRVMITNILS